MQARQSFDDSSLARRPCCSQAAQAATREQIEREHRARAAGMTVEEYMIATGTWPSMHGMPSPEVRAALAARLTRF